MTVQYSTNLKLNKPDTDHKPWDVELQALADLADEALSGYTTKALDADGVTDLTIDDGATSVVRHKVIEFTGALTGDETVNVPALQANWLLVNSSTGGYNLVVQVTGGGGDSINVRPGEAKLLFCDGADVFTNSPVASRKNVLINGALRFDQRSAGAAIAIGTTATYGPDMWLGQRSNTGGTMTMERDSATPPKGFEHYFNVKVTAAASAGAGERAFVCQRIEGLNSIRFGFGKSWAKEITISFWIRSTNAGTYCVGLKNSALDRHYINEYTINAPNTWEYKTITFIADVSGTWLVDNQVGVHVVFDLGSGVNLQNTPDVWAAGHDWTTSNQFDFCGTASAEFWLTGVQFEEGPEATAFEHVDSATELSICEKYMWQLNLDVANQHLFTGFNANTTDAYIAVIFPQKMIGIPSVVVSAGADFRIAIGTTFKNVTGGIISTLIGRRSCQLTAVATGLTAGNGCALRGDESTGGYIRFSAEL